MLAVALRALSIGKGIFSPLASLWRYLTANPNRLAFALLIALSAFLAWRLAAIDGDRDKWRDKARTYEGASQRVKDAAKDADKKALGTAAQMKGEAYVRTERAKQAGAGSNDPIGDIARCLRSEADCRSGQAPR